MAPIRQLTCLDFHVGRFVDAGDCVFDYAPSADQQPYCIVGNSHPTCRLEDVPAQVGSAPPVPGFTPHHSFRFSDRGSRQSINNFKGQ
jgi:hypothetical protein